MEAIDRRKFMKMGAMTGAAMLASLAMGGCASPHSESASSSASGSAGSAESSAAPSSSAASAQVPSTAVVYFSCTGNTRSVAEKASNATSGALMEIIPAVPYTSDDLNYNADCRANAEQNEGSARPELAQPIPDVSGCSTIFLGYPIWWGKAPRIVLSFLEQADLAGKTIVPFCTSGGSGIEGSLPEIEAAATGATVKDARRFSAGASQADIDAWAEAAL